MFKRQVLKLKILVLEARINKDRAVKLQKYNLAREYCDSLNGFLQNLKQYQGNLTIRKEALQLNSETVADLNQIQTILCLFNDCSSSFSTTIQDTIDELSSQQNSAKEQQAKVYAEESEKLNEYVYFLNKQINNEDTSLQILTEKE